MALKREEIETAFLLSESLARQRLPDVHLQFAMSLEDQGRFDKAEVQIDGFCTAFCFESIVQMLLLVAWMWSEYIFITICGYIYCMHACVLINRRRNLFLLASRKKRLKCTVILGLVLANCVHLVIPCLRTPLRGHFSTGLRQRHAHCRGLAAKRYSRCARGLHIIA